MFGAFRDSLTTNAVRPEMTLQAEESQFQELENALGNLGSPRRPWKENSNEGCKKWSRARLAIAKFMYSKPCDYAMMIIVTFNLVIIVKETDEEAKCHPKFTENLKNCPRSDMQAYTTTNLTLLIIYTVEAVLRLYVERKKYFLHAENHLDAMICIVGWVSKALESFFNLSWFRILRVFRLFRATRIVTSVPELRALFVGFLGSMRAMFFGSCLLIGILLLCSVLLVQYIHPICANIDFGLCERCNMGYMSVAESMLTLFQTIIAGDSWGQINMKVIEDKPWPGLMLPCVLLLVGVGAMNLILAVIVDRAVAAREDNKHHQTIEKLTQQRTRRAKLFRMFNDLDTDRSGYLEGVEMREAFSSNEDFQHLMLMADIDREEIQCIFDWIDENGDGSVSYTQFCDILEDIQAADVRKTCVMTKLMMERLARKLDSHIDASDDAMRQQLRILTSIDNKLNGSIANGTTFSAAASLKSSSNDNVAAPQIPALGFTSVRTKSDVEENLDFALLRDWLQSPKFSFDEADDNVKPEEKCDAEKYSNTCEQSKREQKSEVSVPAVALHSSHGSSNQHGKDHFLAQLGKKLKSLQQARMEQQCQIMKDFQRTLRDDAVLASHEIMNSVQKLLPCLSNSFDLANIEEEDHDVQEKNLQGRRYSGSQQAKLQVRRHSGTQQAHPPLKSQKSSVGETIKKWVGHQPQHSLERRSTS